MLAKRRILISLILSTLIVTSNISAQEVDCADGKCRINLNNLKKKSNNINTFKNIQPRFMKIQKNENHNLQVTHEKTYVEKFDLEANKYIKQEGEYLEPETEIEKNTIVLASHKYIMTFSEKEIHNEQQNEIARTKLNQENQSLDRKIIDHNKPPMSLYYCKNDTEPVYNHQIEQFQCVI